MAEYDIGDVISALRVLSVFLPDDVMVGFDGMDVLIRDNRGLTVETRKLALHDAAEKMCEVL